MAQGRKTGGRRKGTPNRVTAERQAAVAASGLTPLDYMLSVMRDTNEELGVRLSAATSAAPYVHPKLSNVAVSGQGQDGAIEVRIVSYSPAKPVGSETLPAQAVDSTRAGV